MERLELDIVMVLPTNSRQMSGAAAGFYRTGLSAESLTHVVFKTIPYKLPNPYPPSARPRLSADHSYRPIRVFGTGQAGGYDGNLIDRVFEYARRCTELVKTKSFDVIHAHDWVTFPAAVSLSHALEKPLVVHVHATEFDRSPGFINPVVQDIERRGTAAAEAVIAVSHYTAGVLAGRYDVPLDKIHVVHNGINPRTTAAGARRSRNGPVVLFLGRITSQKGPEYFVKAAEQVLHKYDKVKFVMAGWGDLAPHIVETVAAKHLGSKILFTGFLHGTQVDNAYRMSDLYVMPSVSEPFGITALEAVQHGLPVIISKTAGVGEVLCDGALKVDFWDVNKMAEHIVEILSDPLLAGRLRSSAADEIRELTWDAAARKCLAVYNTVSRQPELIGQNN
jgi:glycosyltransferase involved in cell wall biosynthesis